MIYRKYTQKRRESHDKQFVFIIVLTILFFLFLIINYPSPKSMTGGIIEPQESFNSAFIRTIIEIINAEHLDSNRDFISNIYGKVKAQDGIWSEEIFEGEYVRVTFEENLTSENDITIYPRVVSGNPRIEVYEKDESEIIAEFTNIISNEYNKVFLTNLKEPQDTFDLLILGGSLKFDYIFDPQSRSLKNEKN